MIAILLKGGDCMSKSIFRLTSVVLVIFLSASVQAELVSFEADTLSNWSPSGAAFAQAMGSAGSAVTMTAESHSTFTVTSTVTNEEGFAWTGYLLELNPANAATFVNGSAGSTKFENVSYPDDWTIMFGSPQEVAVGQVVTMQFDIFIPDDGNYTFTLTQTPIPEPATFALLGLGSLIFLRRRKS